MVQGFAHVESAAGSTGAGADADGAGDDDGWTGEWWVWCPGLSIEVVGHDAGWK